MIYIMLTGLPGSGKTTAALKTYEDLIKKHTVEYISSDKIRGELNGDEGSQANGAKVWERFYSDALNSKAEVVILDATFVKLKDRKIAMHKLAGAGRDFVALSVLPNAELSKARNAARDRKVPEEIIDKMLNSYTLPGISENFSRVYYLNPEDLTLYAELKK